MDAVTLVALPIFALVFSGYGARRLGLLGEPSVAGLPILSLFDWRLLAAYHAVVTVSLALAVVEIGLGGGGRWPSVVLTVVAGLARNPRRLARGAIRRRRTCRDHGPVWAKVAVIEAALPAAATVFVVAQRYELYVEEASSAVLLSTLLSVLTVSLLLAVMAAP